jgi:isopentenyl-diphosphate delta-isomerase
MSEQVILVDSADQAIDVRDKLEAHRRGELHRAFSVFLINRSGEMLIQRRANTKYHTPGLWTNACDGHPRPGETVRTAAERRLQEELGIACPLRQLFAFTYRAALDQDLIEYEYDHVLVGEFDGQPVPNPKEYSDWEWIDRQTLSERMNAHPDQYAPWFKIAWERLSEHDGQQ